MAEDEMVGWHHRLNGHEFGWAPGVGDGQGVLACCGSWGSQRVGHNCSTELTELHHNKEQPPLFTTRESPHVGTKTQCNKSLFS